MVSYILERHQSDLFQGKEELVHRNQGTITNLKHRVYIWKKNPCVVNFQRIEILI